VTEVGHFIQKHSVQCTTSVICLAHIGASLLQSLNEVAVTFFFFTSLTGQIKLRKRGKLHILMSKNNILKPLGSFTTTFILVIISSPPGQFLSLLKKSLVLKGMEGWV
jgi:hypothetical protein